MPNELHPLEVPWRIAPIARSLSFGSFQQALTLVEAHRLDIAPGLGRQFTDRCLPTAARSASRRRDYSRARGSRNPTVRSVEYESCKTLMVACHLFQFPEFQ